MKKIFAAVAAVMMVGIGITSTDVNAGAGQQTSEVFVYYVVNDPLGNGQAVADAIVPEFYFSPAGGLATASCIDGVVTTAPGTRGERSVFCDLPTGMAYDLGIGGLPDHLSVLASFCGPDVEERIDPNGSTFTLTEPHSCQVNIGPNPILYVNKTLFGEGPAVVGDFVIEVFDDGGAPVDTLVDTVDDSNCSAASATPSNTSCAQIPLAPGSYQLGEIQVGGYYLVGANCTPVTSVPGEIFPEGFGEFEHGRGGFETYCSVGNRYAEQIVAVDLVIVNDDGGTAGGADFTIEVFQDGSLVASNADPLPNDPSQSAEFTLPIGEYRFGVSGPDGYTATASVTVIPIVDNDEIASGADFVLSSNQTVSGEITVNDPTTTTTTTTTTTVAPTTQAPTTQAPTTQAPTTQAPTTSIGPETAPVLPETGGGNTGVLALLALALVALGGSVVFATRRN